MICQSVRELCLTKRTDKQTNEHTCQNILASNKSCFTTQCNNGHQVTLGSVLLQRFDAECSKHFIQRRGSFQMKTAPPLAKSSQQSQIAVAIQAVAADGYSDMLMKLPQTAIPGPTCIIDDNFSLIPILVLCEMYQQNLLGNTKISSDFLKVNFVIFCFMSGITYKCNWRW